MSSTKRPGTVDYSKWDRFECSDDSESEDDDCRPPFSSVRRGGSDEEEDSGDSEWDSDGSSKSSSDGSIRSSDGSSDGDDSNDGRPPAPPAPTLAELQHAWNADAVASQISRPCAQCLAPDAPHRCARCRLVRYCDARCQGEYHPIHRLECIDAGRHASFWGIFGAEKTAHHGGDGGADWAVLRARRSAKRRRALQRAAAAAAVERARNARAARGGAAAKGGGGKGKAAEEREEECSVCLCEFTVQGDGGVPFCCPSSHFMCCECAGVWVNSVMGDLETSYPPKCPHCKALMSIESFERQLSSAQQNTFRAHAARKALKAGEELMECKECGLFEVVSNDPVLWWCPHCGCGACRVCNNDLPNGVTKYDIDKSEHRVCASLRRPKALIEEAIEEGSKMRCPSCKLAGRKDEACTHMSCTKCSTSWCYVCGLSVAECDKAPPREGGRVNDIYLHNKDWEVREKRCPMYLAQILEVDLNWLGPNWEENARDQDWNDDERCLDYLHRFRTIQLLQGVCEKIGKKAFVGAFVAFESIKNCGYTVQEIISTDTDHLIDRSEFLEDHDGSVAQGGGGAAFANAIERHQIEMALDVTAPGHNAGGGGDDGVDPNELEARLVSEAMQRSAQSAIEEEQIRDAMARSAELAEDDA